MRFKHLTAALFAAILLFSGCGAALTGTGSQEFPKFEAQDSTGNEVELDELFASAKLTAVCLWSGDCEHCTDQLSALEKISEKFEDSGISAVGIALVTSAPETIESARLSIERSGARFVQIVAPLNFDPRPLMTEYRVPYTLFVDSDSRIVDPGYVGVFDEYELEEMVKLLLETQKGNKNEWPNPET
ncbi:MAG: redoxin domain-containing protein [Oscillospiraceae bacterium]